MSTQVSSQQQLYEIYKNEVLGNTSELTDFSEGSLHDILAGAMTTAQNEISEQIVTQFMKTFFDTASGPTEEDPTDYLENLAVDHFGDTFARPDANEATGEVTFSRPNTNAGDVVIGIGTIVKTKKDANGVEVRFATTQAGTMTGLSLTLDVEAVIAGVSGNADTGKVNVLETTLSDPTITVNNAADMAGGTDAPGDAEYRDIIKNKILSLAGATDAAVEGAARSVPGVAIAKLITEERLVIDWDEGDQDVVDGAVAFRIPYPVVYIADSSGNSSDALIAAVLAALQPVRACGVRIKVKGAVPATINWIASITLNVSGPNYAELSQDTTRIIESMIDYINKTLQIGDDFIKSNANAHIMAIWGPSGTNDLTGFSTSTPSGNVSTAANQKPIAGTVQIV